MSEDDTPLCIGVRNPYVCAEHRLGKKINWKEMKPKDKQKKLEHAFKRPYNELSILYMDLLFLFRRVI